MHEEASGGDRRGDEHDVADPQVRHFLELALQFEEMDECDTTERYDRCAPRDVVTVGRGWRHALIIGAEPERRL